MLDLMDVDVSGSGGEYPLAPQHVLRRGVTAALQDDRSASLARYG